MSFVFVMTSLLALVNCKLDINNHVLVFKVACFDLLNCCGHIKINLNNIGFRKDRT